MDADGPRPGASLMSSRTLALVASLGRRLAERVKELVLAVQDYVLLSWHGLAAIVTPPRYLRAFGARPYVGRLVCVSMVRELGPVLTALMVTGRVGSGMAAELGSMVVTQQIDALRVLGSDPLRKLVAPRLAAGIIMVPILTIISDTLGILGGALISIFSLNL